MFIDMMERRTIKVLRSEYSIEEDPDSDLPFKVRVPDIEAQDLIIRASFLSKKEAIMYAELYSNKVGKCLQCKKVFKKRRRDNELCSKACRQKKHRVEKKKTTLPVNTTFKKL